MMLDRAGCKYPGVPGQNWVWLGCGCGWVESAAPSRLAASWRHDWWCSARPLVQRKVSYRQGVMSFERLANGYLG